MTSGNGFSFFLFLFSLVLPPTPTPDCRSIACTNVRNENVIGGLCSANGRQALAGNRQDDRQTGLLFELVFLQNIVQTIVFIEREKVHTINMLEFEMEQLVEQLLGACNRKLLKLFGIIFQCTILSHLWFGHGHLTNATHLHQRCVRGWGKDAGHNGHGDAERPTRSNELGQGIEWKAYICHDKIGAGIHFFLQKFQIAVATHCFAMHLWVAGHSNRDGWLNCSYCTHQVNCMWPRLVFRAKICKYMHNF